VQERPFVALRQVTKRYGGTVALAGVDLDIASGSIHALVGENGAGKSTLGRIVGGAVRPTSGTVEVGGRPVTYRSPHAALADGIALVLQELALVPHLTVAENVLLGLESTRFGVLSKAEQRDHFASVLERTGFELAPDALVRTLGIADQQLVEILRAVARDARLIVMDEPTSSLTPAEIDKLHAVARDLRACGTAVIYVSHFLDEALELCDTVTVMRNGRVIRTAPAAEETERTLVAAMLGREADVSFPAKRRNVGSATPRLAVRSLTRAGVLEAVSLEVHAGEIVGLAGLVGSGRSETARAIFGADPVEAGRVELDGKPIVTRSPRDAVAAGIALVPESRKEQGLVLGLPIATNMTLPHLESAAFSRASFLRRRAEHRVVSPLLARLGVAAPSVRKPVAALSGGNQQKTLMGKWLLGGPKLLILDEPTRGVDVGARRALHELITDLAADGMGVLLISSDLDEVLGLAHRTLVMRRGRIVAEFGADPERERVLEAAFGITTPEPEVALR
jgi:rhamnose transport system ATP-binding protein